MVEGVGVEGEVPWSGEVRTASDVIRENSVGNPSVERTTPNQKSLIAVISPQHCAEDNSRCGTDNSR